MAALGYATITTLESRMENPYGTYAQYQQYSSSYLPPQFLPPSNQIPQTTITISSNSESKPTTFPTISTPIKSSTRSTTSES